MDFKKLPIDIRNENIVNISVVLNTLDAINFQQINKLCKVDLDRLKLINLIQNDFGSKVITKSEVYDYCVAFTKNIKE
jgi:hypothetical protein